MNDQNNTNNNQINIENNDLNEIDLREILNLILRNKVIIIPITVFFIILGFFESSKQKDIYQGQFQIVLQQNSPTRSNRDIPGLDLDRLGAFISNKPRSDIQTQVEILRSQSVLKPVFEFIKDHKRSQGLDVDKLKFAKWRKDSLKLELESGTTILNIMYDDTDQKLILPVLNKISNIYKNYSSLQIQRKLKKTIPFLENQVEQFDKNSQQSINNLQKFSLENNLIIPTKNDDQFDMSQPFFRGNSNNLDTFLFLLGPQEEIRTKIDEINQKLKFLKDNPNPTRLEIIASQIKNNKSIENTLLSLKQIEIQLQINNVNFTENDPIIKNLKEQKVNFINELRTRITNDLKENLLILEAKKDANYRSKEVLSTYRELFGEAQRNAFSLQNYENELHVAKLALAKADDPWELITEPTLNDEIVGPIRILTKFYYLLYGIFLSLFISIIKEFKNNLIWNENKILKIINLKLLEKLKSNNTELWNEDIKLLLEGPLDSQNNSNNISIIYRGNIKKEKLDKVDQSFRNCIKNREFLITDNINKIKNFKFKIVLIERGTISEEDLKRFINKLSIQDLDITGLILLD